MLELPLKDAEANVKVFNTLLSLFSFGFLSRAADAFLADFR
jgi:hypothetical protein